MNVGVRVDRKLDHATIVLSGPFDLAHSTEVMHAVKSAEAQLHNCRSADISLAQVKRIDGSGAVLLARLLERLAANGCRTDISEGNNPEARHEANVAIKKAIDDQKRHMLIAMTTGTRKTFTLVNEVYRRWHNFCTPDGRVQRRRTLRPK